MKEQPKFALLKALQWLHDCTIETGEVYDFDKKTKQVFVKVGNKTHIKYFTEIAGMIFYAGKQLNLNSFIQNHFAAR